MPAPLNSDPEVGRIARTRLTTQELIDDWYRLLRGEGGSEAEHLRAAINWYLRKLGYKTLPPEPEPGQPVP